MIFYLILFSIQIQYFFCFIKPEDYLSKYGYLQTMTRTEMDIKEALKTFQLLFKLPVTGVFDEKTMKVMSTPRCGNKDPVTKYKLKVKTRKDDQKGYVLEGSKWTNYKLTYKMKAWSTKLNKSSALDTIKSAFKKWSAVTPLRFIYVEDLKKKVHFDMSFATYYHCCHWGSTPEMSKFDGKGGTLAHAAYPQYGGDIHLDDDEPWSLEINPNYPSLLYVLTHEIGHALGLEHSYNLESIMFPYDFNPLNMIDLDKSTINAIRVLYGNESIILP